MSTTPALRLVTETLSADRNGISTTPRHRQIVVDGEASLRLRKDLGNDCYSVLEVLFILAEVSPTGAVIHSANERLQDALGWGRDRVRTNLRLLQQRGFIQRNQETAPDPNSKRLVFGRGVITLNISAVDVIPEDKLQPEAARPDGWGIWGRPLDAEVCRQLLATWGVRGAGSLIEQDPVLASDAVKFVQNALRTGIPIENPGAYARKMITSRRVGAPDPAVPPALLNDELTIDDLLGTDPTQRVDTIKRSREARGRRRRHLDALLRTGLTAQQREEVEMLLDDDLRDFQFTSPETREVYWYHLLEERLAEKGVLGELPETEISDPADDSGDPPF